MQRSCVRAQLACSRLFLTHGIRAWHCTSSSADSTSMTIYIYCSARSVAAVLKRKECQHQGSWHSGTCTARHSSAAAAKNIASTPPTSTTPVDKRTSMLMYSDNEYVYTRSTTNGSSEAYYSQCLYPRNSIFSRL